MHIATVRLAKVVEEKYAHEDVRHGIIEKEEIVYCLNCHRRIRFDLKQYTKANDWLLFQVF